MNGIIITEKNFKSISQRVAKFLSSKEIITWHSFRGGMRRHIPIALMVDNSVHRMLTNVVRRYPEIGVDVFAKDKVVRIQLNSYSGLALELGDIVCFYGNRIQVRTRFSMDDTKYLYQTFQLYDASGGFRNISVTYDYSCYDSYAFDYD